MRRDPRALLLVAPSLLLAGCFLYLPFMLAFYGSFFSWQGGEPRLFIGLEHFRWLLFDQPRLWQAMRVLGFYGAAQILKVMTIPLLAAVLISRVAHSRLRTLYRNCLLTSLIVPGVVVYLVWRQVFHSDPDLGLANRLLGIVGFAPLDWLYHPRVAIAAMILAGFPWAGGVALLIYLAALRSIDRELHDAIRLDGAGPLRRFWLIELPRLSGPIRLVAILAAVKSIEDFSAAFLVTGGGPAGATEVPTLLMYRFGIEYGQHGLGCALGVLLFFLVIIVSAVIHWLIRSEEVA